jgi:ferredoxin
MSEMERLRANAWGRYYVTSDCNGCGVCASCAPDNVAPSWDGSYCAVACQPVGDKEEREMRDAQDACPLQCLHDDGDE